MFSIRNIALKRNKLLSVISPSFFWHKRNYPLDSIVPFVQDYSNKDG